MNLLRIVIVVLLIALGAVASRHDARTKAAPGESPVATAAPRPALGGY